ncbi:MAG: hypothetical protein WC289_03185 [Patescibacteria group bacterium]|jgi:hypothetical protein
MRQRKKSAGEVTPFLNFFEGADFDNDGTPQTGTVTEYGFTETGQLRRLRYGTAIDRKSFADYDFSRELLTACEEFGRVALDIADKRHDLKDLKAKVAELQKSVDQRSVALRFAISDQMPDKMKADFYADAKLHLLMSDGDVIATHTDNAKDGFTLNNEPGFELLNTQTVIVADRTEIDCLRRKISILTRQLQTLPTLANSLYKKANELFEEEIDSIPDADDPLVENVNWAIDRDGDMFVLLNKIVNEEESDPTPNELLLIFATDRVATAQGQNSVLPTNVRNTLLESLNFKELLGITGTTVKLQAEPASTNE